MLDEQTDKKYRFDDILECLTDRHPAETVVLLWRLLAEAGFPPVPLENARPGDPKSGKRPLQLNWQEEARRIADDGTPWPRWCNRDSSYVDELNVGIAAHGLRIVDIDIDDETRADAAQEMAELILGPCPAVRRRDGTGRRAMLYRAADGESPARRRGATGRPTRRSKSWAAASNSPPSAAIGAAASSGGRASRASRCGAKTSPRRRRRRSTSSSTPSRR